MEIVGDLERESFFSFVTEFKSCFDLFASDLFASDLLGSRLLFSDLIVSGLFLKLRFINEDCVYPLLNLGGRAIKRGRLVKLNSLLNDSVKILEIVFSNMFSMSEQNIGDLMIRRNYVLIKI
jgi:hypothetical protein